MSSGQLCQLNKQRRVRSEMTEEEKIDLRKRNLISKRKYDNKKKLK